MEEINRCTYEGRFVGYVMLSNGKVASILKHACTLHHRMGNFSIPCCPCSFGIRSNSIKKVKVEHSETFNGEIEAFHQKYGEKTYIV